MTERGEPNDAQRRFAGGDHAPARRAAALSAARARRARPERHEALRLSVEAALLARERAIIEAWNHDEPGERP